MLKNIKRVQILIQHDVVKIYIVREVEKASPRNQAVNSRHTWLKNSRGRALKTDETRLIVLKKTISLCAHICCLGGTHLTRNGAHEVDNGR